MDWFPFDEAKTAEAAAYLLCKAPGRTLTRFHLLKLLYLAERESLKRYDFPICGGSYYSMENGPVMGDVFSCIQGQGCPVWNAHIETRGAKDVALKLPVQPKRLSRADVEILDVMFAAHGHRSYGSLHRYVHSPKHVPEYEDPKSQMAKRLEIRLESILKALGRSEREIAAVRAQAEVTAAMRKALRK